MTAFAGAARAALALSTILLIPPAGAARAEDSLVIWSPAKLSSYAYRLRLGAKAATAAEMSAGVDISVTASSSGRIRDTRDNARLWAEMRGTGQSGAERNVTAGYNPLTGRVSASAGLSRRWMATPSIDIVLTPAVSADANMRSGDRGAVRVTQQARIQALPTGTSFVATGSTASGQKHIGAELGVEQRVFDCLDLGASVRRQDMRLVGAVRARLRFAW
jgi:hypothetical protein